MFTPSPSKTTSVKQHGRVSLLSLRTRAFCHVLTMLNYSNRQSFERIRARWELTQPGEEQSENMVGRREKQASQQLINEQQQANGASKFRRKLSYGLAFISNPLSQRKTTPGRHVKVPSLSATEPASSEANGINGAVHDCDASLSPPNTKSNVCSNDTPEKTTTSASSVRCVDQEDNDITPRPLPRSHTLSFIPRPVSLQALATNSDMRASVSSVAPPATAGQGFNAPPSKIPTPSPPPSERRDMNPRQYLSPHTSQHVKHIASAQAFQARSNCTAVKAAMRSRTTPNLVDVTNSNRLASFAVPRKSALKTVTASPLAEDALLQENVQDNRRIAQRRSQIHQRPSRRDSLALLDPLPKRRSFGLTVTGNNKQFEHTPPPGDRRRMSALPAQQTPVTARRLRLTEQMSPNQAGVVHVTNNSSFAQSRLLGPKDPPTPTPSIDFAGPVLPLSAPRHEFQRKRLGTPNGLAGVWRSSRALAASNHEVRKLPRSFTFHSFGQREAPPPLPPIPEQYRAASLAHITKYPYSHMALDSTKPKEDISDVYSSGLTPGITDDNKYRFGTNSPLDLRRQAQGVVPVTELSDDSDIFMARPSEPAPSTPIGRQFLSSVDLGRHYSTDSRNRPWSLKDQSGVNNADRIGFLQVKDYMPPLYWAGRFQSRFDQWRTEAMMAHLDPSHLRTGPMSECNLDQERLASCYIFGQLRDLCTSNQAADSLWVREEYLLRRLMLLTMWQEFEYKYRKDHKLLGNPLNLPNMPPFRKQDDKTSTHQGAFGRAVRKLTPRKSSLINLRNLLKGKGKGDEARPGYVVDGNANALSEEFEDSSGPVAIH